MEIKSKYFWTTTTIPKIGSINCTQKFTFNHWIPLTTGGRSKTLLSLEGLPQLIGSTAGPWGWLGLKTRRVTSSQIGANLSQEMSSLTASFMASLKPVSVPILVPQQDSLWLKLKTRRWQTAEKWQIWTRNTNCYLNFSVGRGEVWSFIVVGGRPEPKGEREGRWGYSLREHISSIILKVE